MKTSIVSMLCLTLLACTAHMSHVPHAPPQEAAWFKVPETLPDSGRQNIPGTMAAAIQLAMDDFLPRGASLPSDAGPQDQCLSQRQSYDVEAVPGPEGVIWVSIYPSPGACRQGGPFLDTGSAIYAVDSRQWRVLAVQQP